jgi:hypothetical protein
VKPITKNDVDVMSQARQATRELFESLGRGDRDRVENVLAGVIHACVERGPMHGDDLDKWTNGVHMVLELARGLVKEMKQQRKAASERPDVQ